MQHQATYSPSSVCFLPFCVFPHPADESTDSGHSDQQEATTDLEEEDGMDESELVLLPEVSLSDVRSFSDNHERRETHH